MQDCSFVAFPKLSLSCVHWIRTFVLVGLRLGVWLIDTVKSFTTKRRYVYFDVADYDDYPIGSMHLTDHAAGRMHPHTHAWERVIRRTPLDTRAHAHIRIR